MNRIIKVGIPFLAFALAAAEKPIPAELFGQNIEHTRSACMVTADPDAGQGNGR